MDFLTEVLCGTFSVLLMLTGPKAATVMIASIELNYMLSVVSCYADRFGDENPGFARDDMVSLSPVRLKRLENVVLSGDWTRGLPAINFM
jgi:hypothetical protein